MLEEANGLSVCEIVDHDSQNIDDGVEALIGMANICQTDLVQQDFLDDENGDRLGELCAVLHNPQTEGDNFCSEEEVDDLGIICRVDGFIACRLDECADDTQGGQTEIFEWTCF